MSVRSIARSTATLVAIALSAVGCSSREEPAESPAPAVEAPASTAAPAEAAPAESPASTGTEPMVMQVTDLTPGTGAEIKSGQNALVHYTGWLYDAAAPENE